MTHTKDEAQPAPVQEPALVIYQGEIAKSNLPKGFTGMLYTAPPAAPLQERCESCDGTGDVHDQTGEWRGTCHCVKAAQRQWVGLTDAEILADDTLRHYFGLNGGAGPVSEKGKKIIALIEAKLREKNT